ncbi:Heterokaryon incompatibility protein [Paramyrothecium foliicola]|nr:Heterokaryon incompatibility protein [Paramyrothecium foliicola]
MADFGIGRIMNSLFIGPQALPNEVKEEVVIHLILQAALSWNLNKTESLDWERLTLGPKAGVPPPKPLLLTLGAVIAHGGHASGGSGWRYGLLWATVFHYPKMLFPLWGQWACFIFTYFNVAPTPNSVAGLEYLMITASGYILALPPALVFATFRIAEIFIHPMRRGMETNRAQSGILQDHQRTFFWFLRVYVALVIPDRYAPTLSVGFAFWSFWICLLAMPFVYWMAALARGLQYEPESSNMLGASAPFRYAPLAGPSHIRLLRIRPSLSSKAQVVCSLLQFELHGTIPSYNAISYRWLAGDPSEDECIAVNGFQVAVPPNVLEILKDMRSINMPQFVWLDSLCINQDDLREKETQVSIMRQIYERSANVIIHLAGSDVSPEEGIRVDVMISKLRNARVLHDFSPDDSAGELMPLGSNGDWDQIVALFDFSWFVRVWIVQEVMVARNVRVRLHGREIGWDDLVLACAAISRGGLRSFLHYRYISDKYDIPDAVKDARMSGVEHTLVLDNMRQWYASGKLLPLLDTMILCIRFKSTWDVDKIYALLGIVDVESQTKMGLQPDYSKDKTTLFTEIARKLLAVSSPSDQFRILQFAGIGQTRNMDDLPSWVPDWTAGLPACLMESRKESTDYKASKRPPRTMTPRQSVLNASQHDEQFDCLALHGLVADRIIQLYDVSWTPPPEDSTNFPIRDTHTAVRAHNGTSEKYRSSQQHIDEAFWRTLLADRDAFYRPAAEDVIQVWTLYFRLYDAVRGGGGREELVEEYLKDSPKDEETWELRRLFAALWFWKADDEDMRFAHLLAADLSKRWPDHKHPLEAARVLNRPFDTTQANEPRMSAGRQFCITARGYFGLVPKLSKVNDLVVLFDGAKTPHIIRPSKYQDIAAAVEDTLACRLVGECYMHQGMDGQLEDEMGPEPQEQIFMLH